MQIEAASFIQTPLCRTSRSIQNRTRNSFICLFTVTILETFLFINNSAKWSN